MKLRTKFTLILAATFVVGLLVTGLISYQILFTNAQKEISERAQLMMESAMAMRSYTITHIKPLLKPLPADTFHPETVPAFAAMSAFNSLRNSKSQDGTNADGKDGETSKTPYQDYTYREAALNPTNTADRAVEWENDIIMHFRNHEEAKEVRGSRQTPTGEMMYIAKPIKITQASCLDCHSTPDVAPAAFLGKYGDKNGFGWQLNEIVGAQIVAVPMTVTLDRARSTFLIFMGALGAAAVLAVISLNFAMRIMVVRPIAQLNSLCDQVSKGDFTADDPNTTGNDEISSLGGSFVRMKVSLQKAMKMLED